MPVPDPRALRRFDAYLDGLAAGRADPAGIDPNLVSAARRVHALGAPVPLGSATDRIWTRVPAARPSAPRSTPRHRRRSAEGRGVRSPTLAALATAAMLALVLVGSLWTARVAAPSRSEDGGSPEVYVAVDDAAGARLRPLDPTTLQDAAGSEILLDLAGVRATPELRRVDPGVMESASWLVSTDGSTLVAVESLRRGFTSNERKLAAVLHREGPGWRTDAIFTVPAFADPTGLTADGGLLVLGEGQGFRSDLAQLVDTPRWHVFDTADGRPVATIESRLPSASPFNRGGIVDPERRRLYHLAVRQTDGGVLPPWSTDLTAYDLTTGQVAKMLPLPDVRAGYWPAAVGDVPRAVTLSPAAALAPDGSVLAIVHGDGASVTLVDPERMVVARSVAVAGGGPSVPPALPDGTPVTIPTPVDASAPGPDLLLVGSTRWAGFGEDPGLLYVAGYDARARAPDQPLDEVPLHALNLGDGSVLGPLEVPGRTFLVTGVGGGGLYVSTVEWDEPAGEDETLIVRRVDQETFAVEAERAFPDAWDRGIAVVIVPPRIDRNRPG